MSKSDDLELRLVGLVILQNIICKCIILTSISACKKCL